MNQENLYKCHVCGSELDESYGRCRDKIQFEYSCFNCGGEKTMRCKKCGKSGKDVTKAPDPYAQDIHNDSTPVWMCEPCRSISAQEI